MNQTIDTNGAIHSGQTGQFTGHVKHESDPEQVLSGPVLDPEVDDMLSTADLHVFGYAAVERQHHKYQNAKKRSARIEASERCSLIRTRRLAELTADRFPGAVGVEIEDAYQGETACYVNAVILADGTRLNNETADFEELDQEAFDIYDGNEGWKGAAEESGSAWIIDIAKARQIDENTLTRGYV